MGAVERSLSVSISTLGSLSVRSGFLGGGCSSGSGFYGLGYSGSEGTSDPGLLELRRGDSSGLGSISVRLSFDSTTFSSESILGLSSQIVSSLGVRGTLPLGDVHGLFSGVELFVGSNVGGFGALGSSYGFEPSLDSFVS